MAQPSSRSNWFTRLFSRGNSQVSSQNQLTYQKGQSLYLAANGFANKQALSINQNYLSAENAFKAERAKLDAILNKTFTPLSSPTTLSRAINVTPASRSINVKPIEAQVKQWEQAGYRFSEKAQSRSDRAFNKINQKLDVVDKAMDAFLGPNDMSPEADALVKRMASTSIASKLSTLNVPRNIPQKPAAAKANQAKTLDARLQSLGIPTAPLAPKKPPAKPSIQAPLTFVGGAKVVDLSNAKRPAPAVTSASTERKYPTQPDLDKRHVAMERIQTLQPALKGHCRNEFMALNKALNEEKMAKMTLLPLIKTSHPSKQQAIEHFKEKQNGVRDAVHKLGVTATQIKGQPTAAKLLTQYCKIYLTQTTPHSTIKQQRAPVTFSSSRPEQAATPSSEKESFSEPRSSPSPKK